MVLVPLISVQHGLSNFAILALIASTSMALELSIGNIGLLVVLSMVGRIFGVISNSWITDRIGYKQSLYVAIGLTSLDCLGMSMNLGIGWIGFFGFLIGLAYEYFKAVFAAVAMKMSNPAIAASMFAIFMMFINLGTVGGHRVIWV